jgi:hypothetical protein
MIQFRLFSQLTLYSNLVKLKQLEEKIIKFILFIEIGTVLLRQLRGV